MVMRSEFLIGATRSGSGKTLLTLALLAALSRRGVDVQPFKCGPDFIDPTLHQLMVQRKSINLDLHMMGKEGCRRSYSHYGHDAEAAVVEGVMGLFDGGSASSASLALALDLPVLLVIDVRSAAESVAAVLKGFEVFNPSLQICGVIFNRVGSDRHRQLIEQTVLETCSTEILGFFPRDVQFEMPSRHLGLHMGHEITYDHARLDTLVETVEDHIQIDRLLEVSARVPQLKEEKQKRPSKALMRIGVAQDEAFCFYYHENFKIFKEAGFELVPFSPLRDAALPENINGIYLGGGYPELFAKELSDNTAMTMAIRGWAESGKFIYSECGGFMYMTQELEVTSGEKYPMAGVFPASVKMKDRLSRLGYRKVQVIEDSCLAPENTTLFGHEFHYSYIVQRDPDLAFLYTFEDGTKEGCRLGNSYGSYIHLHFAQTEQVIARLLSQLMNSQE